MIVRCTYFRVKHSDERNGIVLKIICNYILSLSFIVLPTIAAECAQWHLIWNFNEIKYELEKFQYQISCSRENHNGDQLISHYYLFCKHVIFGSIQANAIDITQKEKNTKI